MAGLEEIQGVVAKITFRNEENGFTVLKLQIDKNQQVSVCVGIMPGIQPGESIIGRGEWVNDKRFGLQFSIKAYELIRPTTREGILQLLSSGFISGIGESRAKKIVEKFGDETLMIMEREPQRLLEVSGIGKKRLKMIIEKWEHQRYIKDIILFLQDFGISLNLIYKIYKIYGEKTKEVISANPYKLVDDIWGVGFKKADIIAQKLGYEINSYRRIKAGIIFTLQNAGNEGHVYLPRNELIDKASEILGIEQQNIIYSLDFIIQERAVFIVDERVYLPLFINAENSVTELLTERITYHNKQSPIYNEEKIEQWLENYSRKSGWKGDPAQCIAVKSALMNRILLLTGGPGTGKTTTIQVIVSFYKEHGVSVSLAAPTGRAAQRMGDICGIKAQTIHRLLEFNPGKSGNSFKRNRENPIETGVLICDEVSMIDLLLLRNLLIALKPETTVIFVGDSNQLPSIGAGNVLADMMQSGCIPQVVLSTIFRQAAESRIISAAHEVIKGIIPVFSNTKNENCFFIHKSDPDECLNTIIELMTDRLPARYGIDPVRDIQILSPIHKGTLGTRTINTQLQKKLNISNEYITHGTTLFYKGDKVMQVINNYDNLVFNGDIGYIAEIVEDTGITVDFGDKKINYQRNNLEELVHAYCISIHKSQGCEFNTVIIPIVQQHYIMLQRNLLYTALTRAKRLCILIGTEKALYTSVTNNISLQRYSWLAENLRMKYV